MKERTKVLVDMERMRYPNTGLHYFCNCLKRGLTEIDDTENIEFYGNLNDKNLTIKPFRWFHKFWHALPRKYSVLHIAHQHSTYFPNAGHQKRIVTLHDLNFLFERLSLRSYQNFLSKTQANLNRADVIICISEFTKQCLLDNLSLFKLKPNAEISVIHNGLIFETTNAIQHILSEKIGTSPFILNIGVVQEKKQQHTLVEALPFLPSDWHLVFVYSSYRNDYMDRIKKVITNLSLDNRVHFVQNVSNNDKLALLKNCLAYAHPSIAEGFGYPPIEAMSLGKPTFLSRHTCLPEIGGSESFYFDELTGEGMAKTIQLGLENFASDSDKVHRLYSWAKRYSYIEMAKAYQALYERVGG